MRRCIVILTVLLGLLAPTAVFVGQSAAVNISPNCGSGSASGTTPDVCQDLNAQQGSTTNPIISIIKTAIEIISYVVGALAIIFIMVGAIRMITAGGDAQAVASARSSFTYALVGIIIVVLAQVIVDFVLNKVQ